MQTAKRVSIKLTKCQALLAFLRAMFWAGITLPLVGTAAVAEYRLETGDVVEISVAGVPDLRQRATVGMDGEVIFPIIGQVKAGGVSVADLRNTVQRLFADKMLRRRSSSGHDSPSIVLPEAITIAIVEYRPVYVNGDVAKPGEVVFRPGLTVRKALALSGGYGMRMTNPLFLIADLRSEFDDLWLQFTKEQILIRRLEAELQDKTNIDRLGLVDTPIASSIKAKIEDLEDKQLRARVAQNQREKSTLNAGLKRTNSQLAFLAEMEEIDKQAMAISAATLNRLKGLYKRGLTPIKTVSEARRNVLLQSTRQLQTLGQRALVEKELVELTLRLEKVDGQRRAELLRERQDAEIRLAKTRSRLRAVTEKSALAGIATQDKGDPPKIEIFRKTEAGHRRLAAEEDTELLPGDVVEVTLRKDYVPAEAVGQ